MAANCVHHQMETRKLHRILLSIFLSVLCVCVIVNINYSMGSHCTCTWQTATEAMRRDFYQTQWRLINHFVVDYRPELAVRLDRLTSMKAEANNPEVIALARDVIEPLPSMPALMRLSHVITRTPQAESVDNITEHMRGGFFVECGAYDGERASNTIWLEKVRHWTGLLIEMDPYFYTQLLGKGRRVWSANVCLSPSNHTDKLPYEADSGQVGRLLVGDEKEVARGRQRSHLQYAPCFPLSSLLFAINQTRVDYLSLDVEGLELEVLETIPWNELNIRVLSVEYRHLRRGKQALINHMTSHGYRLYADLFASIPEQSLYVDDFIFVKN